MKRENFGSRLGFILVSAGCAIGLGNVWKFPYMAGQYGGAAFILIYLLFLVILGLPIIVCEFSVGRASQKSIATSYNVLEPKGTRWHFTRWFAIAGNYLLVMFYSMVGGWMLYYCFRMAKGEFAGIDSTVVSAKYDSMLESPVTLTFWTILVILLAFWICSIGLQKRCRKDHEDNYALPFGNHGRTCHKVSYSSGCSRRTQILPHSGFRKSTRKRGRKRYFRSNESSFLYTKHRNGRNGNLRKLFR